MIRYVNVLKIEQMNDRNVFKQSIYVINAKRISERYISFVNVLSRVLSSSLASNHAIFWD